MSINIAILFANYGPYHLARIEGLVKCSQMPQKQIVAIELARSQEEYPWKTNLKNFNFSVVSVIKDRSLEKTNIFLLFKKLNHVLNQLSPNVIVIAGYFQPGMLFTLIWSLLHRKPAILLSETPENAASRVWWREILKSWIVKRYQSALVGGQPHKRYLMKLGMSAEAIFLGYDIVDNKNFHPEKIKHLPLLLNQPYFLSINRFVPKKNLSFLLSCYAKYRQLAGSSAWNLVICGEGQLRPQLEQQIAELQLEDSIHLPGFLQQDALLPYLAHAGCFIHSSLREEWGLVVNEAMAAGLPVLVSNRCGCFEDLVIEGVNGYGFDPENEQELTELMVKMSSNTVDLEAMGQASLKHIQKFSPDYFAQGLIQAIEYALAHR